MRDPFPVSTVQREQMENEKRWRWMERTCVVWVRWRWSRTGPKRVFENRTQQRNKTVGAKLSCSDNPLTIQNFSSWKSDWSEPCTLDAPQIQCRHSTNWACKHQSAFGKIECNKGSCDVDALPLQQPSHGWSRSITCFLCSHRCDIISRNCFPPELCKWMLAFASNPWLQSIWTRFVLLNLFCKQSITMFQHQNLSNALPLSKIACPCSQHAMAQMLQNPQRFALCWCLSHISQKVATMKKKASTKQVKKIPNIFLFWAENMQTLPVWTHNSLPCTRATSNNQMAKDKSSNSQNVMERASLVI